MDITALVVTYNRLDLLKECLNAIKSQTLPVQKIIVVDNNSSDGTTEYLHQLADSNMKICFMKKNLGGSGGFFEGIKYFVENNYGEYLWIMDDDTIPQTDALSKLVQAAGDKNFGFLASNVRWIDKSAAVMNVPVVDQRKWNQNFDKDNFLPTVILVSFVSILIPKIVIEKVGLPYKEFFIWGDDTEYTSRISQQFTSYFVPKSIVIHKMKQNCGVDIITDQSNRLDRYFYSFRNRTFLAQKKHGKVKLKSYAGMDWELLRVIFGPSVDKRFQKSKIILHGMIAGRFFHPKISYCRTYSN